MTKTPKLMKTVLLALISALPIGLGIIKIYAHVISKWRFGYLDYFLAAGLILGGIFILVYNHISKPVVLVSAILIVFELYKGILDYRDIFDVSLVTIATIYLSVSILMYFRKKSKK